VRVNVRVHSASSRPEVGGRYGSSDPPALVVRVAAPAIDGRANDAVVRALAAAFVVRRSEVQLISGGTGRNKVFEVRGADPGTLSALLDR
jgi:hypothetical protein